VSELDDRISKLLAEGWEPAADSGFNVAIGPILTRKKGLYSEFGFLATEAHLNPSGMVHGGAIMTLIDIVLGGAAREQLNIKGHVTIQLDIKFQSPANCGDFLQGQGRVCRDTSSIVFLDGGVAVGPRVVASATGLWKKRRPPA